MAEVLPFPSPGDVFTDVRGDDRTMRVSYHHESDLVVVSLWAGRDCRASFRLAADDLTRLIAFLNLARAGRPTADQPTTGRPTDGQPDAGDREPQAEAC